MEKNSKFIRTLPLSIVVAYLLITIMIFFMGPYPWPVTDKLVLIAFLAAVISAIIFGFLIGLKFPVVGVSRFNGLSVFLTGAIISCLLLVPATYVYTGTFPWDIFVALKNQGMAYYHMEQFLLTPGGAARTIVSVLRIITSPWTMVVIPLGILNFRSLKISYKGLFFIYIVTQLVFSAMRGTDKEVADLIITAFSSLLVVYGRAYYAKKLKFDFRKTMQWSVGIVLCLTIALMLFNERKYQRVTSYEPYCTYNICPSYSGAILSKLNSQEKFSFSMLASYLSQGYYGLSIALSDTGKFQSTYGLGHSMALLSIYTKLTHDQNLYQRSYMYKINQTGRWSDLITWSTIFPSIASDISFPLVPFFMVISSALFAITWRDAIEGDNNYAAIVFTFLFMLFLYTPANNQIAQSLGSYFAFCVWLILWIYKRQRGSHLIA